MVSYLYAILLFWSCAFASKTYKYLPIYLGWYLHNRYFIEEKLRDDIICTPYTITGEQVYDILTNGVSSSVIHSTLYKLGMRDIYASTWGG